MIHLPCYRPILYNTVGSCNGRWDVNFKKYRMKKLIYIVLWFSSVIISAQGYTLEQCIEMSLENSYEIKNSRIDLEMADQVKNEAFTKYFPSVSATGVVFQSSDYLIDETVDLSMVSSILTGIGMGAATPYIPSSIPIQKIKDGVVGMVSATQPIFAGGQIINGNRLASVGRDVDEMEITLTENGVISKTEEYFWNIVSLKEKLKTLDVVTGQLDELHKTLSAAVEAGVAEYNDLLRLELQQHKIESNRLKVENGIKIYKLLLCNQIGAEETDFEISISEFPLVSDPEEYFIPTEEGLRSRVETQMLGKGVEAASLQRKMAIGKNMPIVAAGAGYFYHNVLERDVDFGMVFGTVSIPISSWWSGAYEIKSQKLNETKAQNQLENMGQLLIVDIESKWNQLTEAYQQTLIAQKTIESASENLRNLNNFFDAGTVSLTDLLEAQTILQQGKDQYVDSCSDYFMKLTAYLQSTGRRTSAEFAVED